LPTGAEGFKGSSAMGGGVLSEEFRAGSLLAGYRLEERIGAGGMAVVFRARDERLGRLVALKILAPEMAEDQEFRRRFIAESRAAAKVEDPHIIPVYEAGEADGVLYIAMRFVAGGDLRRVLKRERALAPGNPGDLFTSTLVGDLKREAPLFQGLPTPQVTQLLGSQLCGAATVDIYAGRHDRPPVGNGQFSAFLQLIEDDCHSGQKPFIIADDGVSRFIADPAARDESGLGEPAISYVTEGITLLGTRNECLHPATAAAAQTSGEPFGSFCTIYAAIVQKLFNLPKVQGQGLDFLWTGERVGLAFDAANLFLDAENNYQGSHPGAIGRAEIPGQFISDPSWQGVTGQIGFTPSQHMADLPLAIVRIKISSPTATPTCGYLGQGQVFGPGPGTGPCPEGSD
jgi:Protein kinase domain